MNINEDLLSLITMMKPTWEHHSDQIFIKDLNFRYIYVNPRFLETAGLKIEEVLNKTGFEIFPSSNSNQNKKFEKADFQIVEKKEPIEYEAIFHIKGEKRYNRTIKSPILNQNREVIGIYGLSRNIEPEIETRVNLNENYKLLDTIFETIPYPIFIKDLEMHYVKVNKAYADIVEYTIEEIVGMTDSDIYDEEISRFLLTKDRLVLSTETRQFYLTVFKKKSFMIIKEPIRDYDGNITGILGISNPFLDVSELQERIMGQKKIESLSALAGGIAHDLKNHLTLIQGYSDLLTRRITNTHQANMASSINNAAIRSVTLVERLVTFTKQTHGDWKEIDLRHITEEAIILCQANLPHNITISRNYSDNVQQFVGDETQISQLVLNLLINAIDAINEKFTENSDITNESIVIEVDEIVIDTINDQNYTILPVDFVPGTYIRLQVSDTGPGISHDKQGKIFDPFYTTKNHGTGLGLSVVYGVISTHQGLLQLTSELGIGTTFSIYLPVNGSIN